MAADIRIHSSNDPEIMKKIEDIFSHGKSIEDLQPPVGERPLLIILGGSPGVGKTSQARRILQKMGHSYDNFYHVSLDDIMEHMTSYRENTWKMYDTWKTPEMQKPQLTNQHLGKLSGLYLKSLRMESDSSLLKRRLEALEYGVKHGLNITYDTTFSPKNNIVERDILPILNKHVGELRYEIHVILVTSSERQIRKQLEERHRDMINQGFIRGIPLKVASFLTKDNRTGFKKIQDEVRVEGAYGPDDFHFRYVDNLPKRNENNERESGSSSRSQNRSQRRALLRSLLSSSRSTKRNARRSYARQSYRR